MWEEIKDRLAGRVWRSGQFWNAVNEKWEWRTDEILLKADEMSIVTTSVCGVSHRRDNLTGSPVLHQNDVNFKLMISNHIILCWVLELILYYFVMFIVLNSAKSVKVIEFWFMELKMKVINVWDHREWMCMGSDVLKLLLMVVCLYVCLFVVPWIADTKWGYDGKNRTSCKLKLLKRHILIFYLNHRQ